MVTVNDILTFVQTIAPTEMKYSWDHIGLNCGHFDTPVSKILVALDPFSEVIDEAIELDAQLLVTHHALIWDGGFINTGSVWGKNALRLIEHGIAHINAHTNLDCAPGGVNDVLADRLGLTDVTVANPMGADSHGQPYGLLRVGTVPVQSIDCFLSSVKSALGCEHLRYVSPTGQVHRVAVGGGSCGSDMEDAIAAGCDTFVTADIKYNLFREAYDRGLNLIDAGHFHTENPVCAVIAEKIQAKFPEVQVFLSKKLRDHMKFY